MKTNKHIELQNKKLIQWCVNLVEDEEGCVVLNAGERNIAKAITIPLRAILSREHGIIVKYDQSVLGPVKMFKAGCEDVCAE